MPISLDRSQHRFEANIRSPMNDVHLGRDQLSLFVQASEPDPKSAQLGVRPSLQPLAQTEISEFDGSIE